MSSRTEPPSPFAPPAASLDAPPIASHETEDERVRRKYLSHEASVKSLGALWGIGGGVTCVGVLGVRWHALVDPVDWLTVAAFELLGAAVLVLGLEVHRLAAAGRGRGAALAGLMLLSFPVGTLVGGYFLYLLLSEKGRVVFSDEYKAVIARTPHVRYRTSILVWVLLGFVIFAILAAIALPSMVRP